MKILSIICHVPSSIFPYSLVVSVLFAPIVVCSSIIIIMKTTKVQNPWRIILHILRTVPLRTMPMRVRGKLATPLFVAVNTWCFQFSLQHGLAASVGIVLSKAECCWQSLGIL